jgi:hypothetical protein
LPVSLFLAGYVFGPELVLDRSEIWNCQIYLAVPKVDQFSSWELLDQFGIPELPDLSGGPPDICPLLSNWLN